jgi:hypothetical protein
MQPCTGAGGSSGGPSRRGGELTIKVSDGSLVHMSPVHMYLCTCSLCTCSMLGVKGTAHYLRPLLVGCRAFGLLQLFCCPLPHQRCSMP